MQVNFTYVKSGVCCKNSSLSLHWKSLVISLGLSIKPAIQRGKLAISRSHSRQLANTGLESVFLAPQLSALDCTKKKPCENKVRFWILTVTHFTYGSRDLKFYWNVR